MSMLEEQLDTWATKDLELSEAWTKVDNMRLEVERLENALNQCQEERFAMRRELIHVRKWAALWKQKATTHRKGRHMAAELFVKYLMKYIAVVGPDL